MKEAVRFHVAVYIRLSREDGDKAESDSIGNQRKLIADYLRGKEEFVVYDTYVDDGFTGTNFSRPSFIRMIADIEAGKINCVVVKDLSRFGRDYIDTGKYLERYFPDRDIRFISVTDNIDSLKQAYDMLVPIKNIFNEQYARDISKKVHASMKTKQKAGEFIGAFACYGYKKSPSDRNKLVVDAYAADVVRRIFELYISGYGKNGIATLLNRDGVICPAAYKRRNGENYKNGNRLESTDYWTYSTINRILQNEMYIGNMVQGRKTQHMRGRQRTVDREEWIVVKNTHEAIIDPATWEKTQNLLKRRTRNLDLNQNRSVFAGFLKCGDCGRALVKKSGSPGHGAGDVRYVCGTYVRSGRQFCTAHTISGSLLEEMILDDLRTLLKSVGDLQAMIGQAVGGGAPKDRSRRPSCENAICEEEAEKTRMSAELARIRKLKKSLYEDFRGELLSKEEYMAYRQEYLDKEKLLLTQLASLEKRQNPDADRTISRLPWIRKLLETGNVERLDRSIVAEMLEEIRVFEDHRIKITYNYMIIQADSECF